MQIQKELSDISLQISEPEYRAMPELSYSTLSTYEREGFDKLDHLFDKKETPSLTLGSAVDAILTGGQEEFEERFYVAEFPSLGDKESTIVKDLFSRHKDTCPYFYKIPNEDILAEANLVEFQKNWRDDTRIKVLTERCSQYYNLLFLANNRTIISTNIYTDVINMVNALKNSFSTSGYFADNQENSPVKRYYQLKFKANLRLKDTDPIVGYRCMMDLAVVDYEDKTIIPVDLKTSGHSEWNFQDSFIKWSY